MNESQFTKAVAFIVLDATGNRLPGAVCMLNGVMTPPTNAEGYVDFPHAVPAGAATVIVFANNAKSYVQPVSLDVANQQIWVGGGGGGNSINLPPLSFKRPLPSVPSREAVCDGQLTAQAINVESLVYGTMPWWPACWAWLTPEDRAHIAPQLLKLGDTIMLIAVPSGVPLYDEGGQFYNPDRFPAKPYDPAALADLVVETLGYGFAACWLFLGGDASYDTACAQVEDIAPRFTADTRGNLNQFVAYVPGWDGTWHKPQWGSTGYTPQQVNIFAARARAAGAIHLGFEHGTGYAPVGEGGGDFKPGGNMSLYDFVLGEFDSGAFNDDVWQILGRFVRPYIRPANQPPWDDPNPPFYLATPSARGPYFYHIFEWAMYVAVRGEALGTMAGWRAQFAAMAPTTRIC